MVRDDEDKREMRRREIMKATLRVFSEKGYSPMVLDDVAREAGIAKGTLYLYFKDKEDLFHSTIMSVIEEYAGILEAELSDDMPPLDVLELVARSFIAYFGQNREFFNIHLTVITYNLMSNYSRLFEDLVRLQKEFFSFLSGVMDRGKREGAIRPDVPTRDLVVVYYGILDQSVTHLMLFQEGEGTEPERMARSVMHIFLEGAASR
ncbi:MAG: TetR/AcrR family transcriptional regulator [Spirochaetota bacterium]